MAEGHDSHGHIRRAVAQFFLTINTLFPFVAGGATAIIAAWFATAEADDAWARACAYGALMFACFVVSYGVAMSRLRVMGISVGTVSRAMRRHRG